MFSIFKKKKKSKYPATVEIEQVEPNDEELEEEWQRVCEPHLIDMYGVYAAKWKDGEFRWEVTFGAGEFIREEPFVTKLNEQIYDAISSLEGVKEVHHEDTEKYVISGEIHGQSIIRNVSLAIDAFAKEYMDEWEKCLQ